MLTAKYKIHIGDTFGEEVLSHLTSHLMPQVIRETNFLGFWPNISVSLVKL